jgi:hypothetical protein
MGVTRNRFLRLTGAAAAGWLMPPSAWPASQDVADDLRARVSRTIQDYDAQGIHRTATDVDDRSAAWLADEARSAGADAVLEEFDLSRIDVRGAFLGVGDRAIEGLPLFDGGFTDERGVSGRLGAPDMGSEVALVELDAAAISSEGRSIAESRRSNRHQALVAVTVGAHEGLSPTNAASFAHPFGVPVLQVSSEARDLLRDHARRRAEVRVVAHAVRTADRASNVAAMVRGRRGDLAPVVVMTPRSGWWHCAGERGGGIACWLEACRAVARAHMPRTMIFVASSGHELGHFGLDAFISKRPGLVKEAAAWIHLGANIGAAGGTARLQASDDAIESLAADALKAAGAEVRQRVPQGTVPGGEARNIHLAGGRYVSLLGSSPVFHSLADRWPAAVDAAAVARFASAVADLVVTMARQL